MKKIWIAMATTLFVLGVLPAFSSEEEKTSKEVVQGDDSSSQDSPAFLYAKKKDKGDCGCGK